MQLMQSDIDTTLLRATIRQEMEKFLREAGVLPEGHNPKQPHAHLHIVKDPDDA